MKRHALALLLGLLAMALVVFGRGAPEEVVSEGAAAIRALESRLPDVVPHAMAQTHKMLVDTHTAAGVTCETCHGGAAFTEPVKEASCVKCHGTSADMAAKTPREPNPHRSHMGELACATCHNVHKPSVSFCDQCHAFGMQVP
jgi:fumarate reductase flavoprotein subunit